MHLGQRLALKSHVPNIAMVSSHIPKTCIKVIWVIVEAACILKYMFFGMELGKIQSAFEDVLPGQQGASEGELCLESQSLSVSIAGSPYWVHTNKVMDA